MKKGYIYTVCFMLVLSIILGTGLALANSFFAPQIEKNRALAEKKAVLDAFGLDIAGSPDEINQRFTTQVQEVDANGRRYYRQVDSAGRVAGIAIPFSGPGLWGTIEGYLAVSADRLKVLGIVFTAQNETPGLGGRIDEAVFRDQFRQLAIIAGQDLAYGSGDGQLDAISGATSSSKAVLAIVNNLIDQTLPELEVVP
jgi:Na+-transporting NADH:ubiquinone oxidoreductase subunit C